jgi:hypothetical protein
MLARVHRTSCTALAAALGALACATNSAVNGEIRPAASYTSPTSTSRVIDAERIARSGSQTAFDALRAFVPSSRLTASGPFSAVESRGAVSAHRPLPVVLDDHPVLDVESLRLIPARDVLAIRVMSPPEAAMRLGPRYNQGAVLIQTQASLRRL